MKEWLTLTEVAHLTGGQIATGCRVRVDAWNEGYKAGEANENHFYWHAEGTES